MNGTVLNITRVNRLHMGAYLCIASNGVPPTVSKRIMLIIQCEYYEISRLDSNGSTLIVQSFQEHIKPLEERMENAQKKKFALSVFFSKYISIAAYMVFFIIFSIKISLKRLVIFYR